MSKRKVGIRLWFLRGVSEDVRVELRRVAAGFARVSEVRHDILVDVVAYPGLQAPDGSLNWGLCSYPLRRKPLPFLVWVAGLVPRSDLRRGYARRLYGRGTPARVAGHTLLHELAHYEQYRDGREMVERGVNVRAAGLYRRIDALVPA